MNSVSRSDDNYQIEYGAHCMSAPLTFCFLPAPQALCESKIIIK